MWADNETSEDLLGFKVHADLLIDVINDDSLLPITIGVFGDWGSGKSSILRIIHEDLKGGDEGLKDDTLVLFFNGWMFEGYDDAKAALLESIVRGFEENKTLSGKVEDQTKKLLRSVDWMRVMGFGFKKIALPAVSAYFTGGVSLIPHLAQELKGIDSNILAEKLTGEGGVEFLKSFLKKEEDVEESTKLIREFREDFKKLIEKSAIKKLVVIIDDLDRCTPDRIIENLEAIKLFLNVDKTAFVIGADPRIVKHAIEYRYKTQLEVSSNNDGNSRIVTDYLEKLIQVPYNLPKLSDSEVETYLTLLLCKKELGGNFCDILEVFKQHKERDRYSVFGLGNLKEHLSDEQNKQIGAAVPLIASLASVITEGLNGNPRQIKRFLNSFELRRRLALVANIHEFRADVLAKLMVLEYFSLSHFKILFDWQSSSEGQPSEINEFERILLSEKSEAEKREAIKAINPEWAVESVLRWLKVEPSLSEVDLRDYFWISRDQLSNSISGASLIPGHVRMMYKKIIDAKSGKILSRIIREEVVNGSNESDQAHLLGILERELTKEPNKDNLHLLYFELISHGMIGSFSSYQNILLKINHDDIPFSIRQDLLAAERVNPKISEIIKLYSADSKIGRALKKKSK